jgi:hypothetical protein
MNKEKRVNHFYLSVPVSACPLAATEISRVGFHTLRHSFATIESES